MTYFASEMACRVLLTVDPSGQHFVGGSIDNVAPLPTPSAGWQKENKEVEREKSVGPHGR